jgi:hypothetical protein
MTMRRLTTGSSAIFYFIDNFVIRPYRPLWSWRAGRAVWRFSLKNLFSGPYR